MAHSGCGSHNCTLCQEDDKINIAVTWCIECETFLCTDCNKTHGRIKASKNHHATSVESFNELPDFVTKMNNNCGEHGKRFDAYCSDHTVACCVDCIIRDHTGCKNIRSISDVLKDFKSSASVFHVERNLGDLLENFETIDKYLATRLVAVDTQKTNAEKAIKTEKQKIIDHLNMIEKRFVDDLKSQHSNIRSKIERLQKDIKIKKTEIEQLQTDYTKMKEFATELQMFEGIKEIEKLTTEQTQYINDCTTKGLLNDTDLEVKFSHLVKSITTDMKSFGNISVSVNKSFLKLKQGEGQQVSTECLIKPTIDQIKPKIKKVIDLPKDQSIYGCQILPDGRMVFANYSKKTLMLYSKEDNYVRDIVTFPKHPCYVTYIRDNVVAVTSYFDVEVYFVDIESYKIIKTINVKEKVCGMDNDGSTIRLLTGYSKTIINLNHDGEILSPQSIEAKALCIATFEDKIYISEFWEHKISCYKKNGSMLWTFNSDEMRNPRGISVDKHGFVYVACCDSNVNNVIVVSPDGKQSKVILNNSDGISSPTGLSIDRKSSSLLVANVNNGKGHLLQLS